MPGSIDRVYRKLSEAVGALAILDAPLSFRLYEAYLAIWDLMADDLPTEEIKVHFVEFETTLSMIMQKDTVSSSLVAADDKSREQLAISILELYAAIARFPG